jgi:hypothetical protein
MRNRRLTFICAASLGAAALMSIAVVCPAQRNSSPTPPFAGSSIPTVESSLLSYSCGRCVVCRLVLWKFLRARQTYRQAAVELECATSLVAVPSCSGVCYTWGGRSKRRFRLNEEVSRR